MSELKPCPFCGSKEVRQVEGDEYSWCMNPSCAIYDYEIRTNEWNMRAESAELAHLREQVKVLRAALGSYAECCDGCTCGDGRSHDIAIEALEQTKPKGGE